MKILRNLIAAVALTGIFLVPAQSDAGVRVFLRFGPPSAKTVKIVKPPKPYPHAAWISGHWVFRNNRYVWVKGYWIKPRSGYVYVPGHSRKTHRGWYFVPGHWVKK